MAERQQLYCGASACNGRFFFNATADLGPFSID
jgi:hypothetical protein